MDENCKKKQKNGTQRDNNINILYNLFVLNQLSKSVANYNQKF